MLKKSLVLGVLAAMTMAPAAFAGDQVQGNSTNTNINAGNVGYGNSTKINNGTYVNQNQSKYQSRRARHQYRKCSTGNQVQGNATNTSIAVGNVGDYNRARVNNETYVNQAQSAVCR